MYNQIEEKKNYIHLQKSIYTNEILCDKKVFRVYHVGIDKGELLTSVARFIGYGYKIEIHIYDNGNLIENVSQERLLDTIIDLGANARANRLIMRKDY